ncbi:MAG: thioredoxin family protein [Pseudomonadota bacterium]|nr:thioredoxin family protein [Pseudomonadota bacterium]
MPRLIRLFLACLALAITTLAHAGDILPYSASTFAALTQAGKPVAIAVHASWCSTCKAQKPIQQALMAEPAFKAITLLLVDFDGDQAVLQRFKVRAQSTLIVFKGSTEVGRSVGDTTRAGMAALFQRAAS